MFFRQLVDLVKFSQKKIVENPCLNKKSIYLCTPLTTVGWVKIWFFRLVLKSFELFYLEFRK
jgi:hypothetical protein